jgi:acyl-CoA reductase-like NAD-dependent aldehyde dehydrogenase
MTAHSRNPSTTDPAPRLEPVLDKLRSAYLRHGAPSCSERREHLKRLGQAVLARQESLIAAVSADFGQRSRTEFLLAEVYTVLAAIRHARRHLRGWMRERRVPMAMDFWPARARLRTQPLGVVGIIGPWNYPVLLCLSPLVAALAAGNRVLLKPSELTPRTSSELAALLGGAFPPDQVAVVQGGAEAGAAVAALPLDHLLYTGSTAVGRQVLRAAAENLTPVTLEMGGKSPAIIGPDARLDAAAASILYGKLFNAGQTCIAPDYVLLPEANKDEFVRLARAAAARMYPRFAGNPDYTAIVNRRHWERLLGYLEECRVKGAEVVPLWTAPDGPDAARRILPPSLLIQPGDALAVAREEIFGPLLVVYTYRRLEDAVTFVNARPRPLALYYYGECRADRELILGRIVAGGVTVNDSLLHFVAEGLPFGGIGASGMGAYHGIHGFETFSKKQPIVLQPRFNFTGLLRPPYGKTASMLLSWLIRRP